MGCQSLEAEDRLVELPHQYLPFFVFNIFLFKYILGWLVIIRSKAPLGASEFWVSNLNFTPTSIFVLTQGVVAQILEPSKWEAWIKFQLLDAVLAQLWLGHLSSKHVGGRSFSLRVSLPPHLSLASLPSPNLSMYLFFSVTHSLSLSLNKYKEIVCIYI